MRCAVTLYKAAMGITTAIHGSVLADGEDASEKARRNPSASSRWIANRILAIRLPDLIGTMQIILEARRDRQILKGP